MTETLKDIKQDILDNLSCPLKDAATHLVFGKGNPQAEIFFIGEAPGAKEDEMGVPFVGRAGKELDKLLQTIGLTIDDVYIANILKYRPPKNRDPTTEEMHKHTPYLVRQIEVVNPKVIIPLGNFATKFVLAGLCVDGMKKIPGVSALHGEEQTLSIGEKERKIIPMYHPAAMLYRPQLRADVEEDFRKVRSLSTGVKRAKKVTDF